MECTQTSQRKLLFLTVICVFLVSLVSLVFQPCLATDIGGYINTDSTLTLAASPYNITSNLYVRKGATLTIEDSVEINFTYRSYNIYIGNSSSSQGSIIANDVTFNGLTTDSYSNYIYIRYGSTGTISNTTLDNVELFLSSSSPTLSNLSFNDCKYLINFDDTCSPVISGLTYSDITYPGISIQGDIYGNYTLPNYNLPYFLISNYNVRDEATLNIASGDTLYFNSSYDLRVGYYSDTSTLNANNVHFYGYSSSTGDQFYFDGAGGTITNCVFTDLDVEIDESSPTITNCVFDNSPIDIIEASPVLSDLSIKNTDYLLEFSGEANPTISNINYEEITYPGISISGTIYNNYTLQNYSLPYYLTGTYTIRGGSELKIASGDTIYFKSSYDFRVGYSSDSANLVADNVFFKGYSSSTSDELIFTGAGGSISNCDFENLTITLDQSSPTIQNSHFDNSPIYLSGSPVISDVLFENQDYVLYFNGSASPTLNNIDTNNIANAGYALSGYFDEDMTLKNYNLPYYINGDVYVRYGASLTIESGNTLFLEDYDDITIGYSSSSKGNLYAENVQFISESYYGGTLNFKSGGSGLLNKCVFDNVDFYFNDASATIKNSIIRNTDQAFYIYDESKPHIDSNEFYNVSVAVNNYNGDSLVIAENNFWGHYSGPTHDSNSIGIGAIITGDVDYMPFLTTPIQATLQVEYLGDEALSFDTVYIGETDEIDVQLTSKGTGDIMITGVSSASGSFISTSDFPVWISKDDTMDINISFAPSEEKNFIDTVYIHTSDINNKEIPVVVKGYGVDVLYVSDTVVNFGDVYLRTRDTSYIYLKNNSDNYYIRIDSVTTSSSVFRVKTSDIFPTQRYSYNEISKDAEIEKRVTQLTTNYVYRNDSLILAIMLRPTESKYLTDTMRVYYSNYGVKEIILKGTGYADELDITIQSIDYKNFPYVYINAKVDTFGTGISTLTTENFYCNENGVDQTTNFYVTPPGESGGTRLADIVFLMDNSGSMEDEQSAIQTNVESFVNELSSSGIDYSLGLCRYGASENSGDPIFEDNGSLTSDADYFKDNVWLRNEIDGGTEPGYRAIYESSSNFSFRAGAQKIAIIITDETPDQDDIAINDALDVCEDNSIMIFALTISDLYDDFLPITDATGGEVYDITSSFNEILNYISSIVGNTYVVQYESTIETWGSDGILAELFVDYNKKSDSDTIRYYPGGVPVIERTSSTLLYHTQSWDQNTSFDISVNVTDNTPPYTNSVMLFYRSVGAPKFVSCEMTTEDSVLYTATIDDSVAVEPGLEYYIQASDSNSTVTLPSSDARTSPFQIAILPNIAPTINLQDSISYYNEGDSIIIYAEIYDNTNELDTALLYYRRIGQLVYQATQFINISGNNYYAVIPYDFPDGLTIEYYIKATDDFQINSYKGWPDDPIQIQKFIVVVSEEPVDEDFILLYPNPASKYIVIESSANNTKTLQASLVDLKGQKVKEFYLTSGTFKYDVSQLPSGIYMLDVLTDSKTIRRKLVVE